MNKLPERLLAIFWENKTMNKLMGFYELRELSIPTIQWEEYKPGVELSDDFLWTVRSAVNCGNDLNLPRLVGKNAEEAMKFADDLYKKISNNGIVVYYPYFIAHKSGTLNVYYDKTVIEAVENDLWNLVTYQNIDVSLTINKENNIISSYGKSDFLSNEEIEKLMIYSRKIHGIYRNEIIDGNTILLEWSFAYSCNKNKQPVGDPYLVFYEVRTTK